MAVLTAAQPVTGQVYLVPGWLATEQGWIVDRARCWRPHAVAAPLFDATMLVEGTSHHPRNQKRSPARWHKGDRRLFVLAPREAGNKKETFYWFVEGRCFELALEKWGPLKEREPIPSNRMAEFLLALDASDSLVARRARDLQGGEEPYAA